MRNSLMATLVSESVSQLKVKILETQCITTKLSSHCGVPLVKMFPSERSSPIIRVLKKANKMLLKKTILLNFIISAV